MAEVTVYINFATIFTEKTSLRKLIISVAHTVGRVSPVGRRVTACGAGTTWETSHMEQMLNVVLQPNVSGNVDTATREFFPHFGENRSFDGLCWLVECYSDVFSDVARSLLIGWMKTTRFLTWLRRSTVCGSYQIWSDGAKANHAHRKALWARKKTLVTCMQPKCWKNTFCTIWHIPYLQVLRINLQIFLYLNNFLKAGSRRDDS